jgi:hypothetical protein
MIKKIIILFLLGNLIFLSAQDQSIEVFNGFDFGSSDFSRSLQDRVNNEDYPEIFTDENQIILAHSQ